MAAVVIVVLLVLVCYSLVEIYHHGTSDETKSVLVPAETL